VGRQTASPQTIAIDKGKKLPSISIITPSFNQGQYVERTILSVLNQNYPNLEYFVIDGGSIDDSVAIIRKYEKRLSAWVSENDRGQSHAFNKGLALAGGEIIGWLNSDDIYYPGTLERIGSFFAAHPETDVLFGDYAYIDPADEVVHIRREIPFNRSVYLWGRICPHANCAGFFRKRCFQGGGLNENLHFCMDYELYLRLWRNGCRFSHLRQPLAAMRIHPHSKTVALRNKQRQEGREVYSIYCHHTRFSAPRLFALKWFYRSYRIFKKATTGCYRDSLRRLPRFLWRRKKMQRNP